MQMPERVFLFPTMRRALEGAMHAQHPLGQFEIHQFHLDLT